MKKTVLLIISFYQSVVSVILKNTLGVNKFCRYSPTCTEYTKNKIKEEGLLKGLACGALRIIRCNPFYKPV